MREPHLLWIYNPLALSSKAASSSHFYLFQKYFIFKNVNKIYQHQAITFIPED